MKTLQELISELSIENIPSLNPTITALEYDSRKVEAGNCFFAVVGTASDGHNYIDAAIERGAVAVEVVHSLKGIKFHTCFIALT